MGCNARCLRRNFVVVSPSLGEGRHRRLKPVRSELTYMLVKLDRDYAAERPDEPWEGYYARALVEHFAA